MHEKCPSKQPVFRGMKMEVLSYAGGGEPGVVSGESGPSMLGLHGKCCSNTKLQH